MSYENELVTVKNVISKLLFYIHEICRLALLAIHHKGGFICRWIACTCIPETQPLNRNTGVFLSEPVLYFKKKSVVVTHILERREVARLVEHHSTGQCEIVAHVIFQLKSFEAAFAGKDTIG